LQASDDVTLGDNSILDASGNVVMEADLGTGDVGTGVAVSLNGGITGNSLTVTTGDDGDTINLNEAAQVTTINTSVGNDVINFGNGGNTLNQFAELVTVDGGTGTNTLNINN
jgi:hypothetical protein